MSGNRNNRTSFVYGEGINGFYWAASVITISGRNLYFSSTSGGVINPGYSSKRANGFAVRCIKD
jgi:hypothetical protein